MWVPLGDLAVGVGSENATSEPAPGELLLYPVGESETEILVPYGQTRFAAVTGPLKGNHFLTLEGGLSELAELGHHAVWHGAQDVSFEVAD